ncbi:MAG: MaoC/PaaZ C-terminal domain-containing protein [Flavobacteriales bacterium]
MEIGEKYELDYSINEHVYNGFLNTFKDHNPLHTNEDFAKEKGFPKKVMHGNILNGCLSHFIGEELPTKDVIIHAQEINFLKPVYLNDTVTLKAVLKEKIEAVSAFVFKYTFVNQDGVKVARGKIQIGII